MSKKFTSFTSTDPIHEVENPKTGEKFSFLLGVNFMAVMGDKYASAQVVLNCSSGGYLHHMLSYYIEPMNPFSLLVLTDNYRAVLRNWLSVTPTETIISETLRKISAGRGPIIRINGREVKGLDLQICEVTE
jgi:hypothetical protein